MHIAQGFMVNKETSILPKAVHESASRATVSEAG